MSKRETLKKEDAVKKDDLDNLYGIEDDDDLSGAEFFSSGCTLFDCVLSGGKGWVEDRIGNLIGDNSTGKTLVAFEAIQNFLLKYPDAQIVYAEAESAFDKEYMSSMGIDINKIQVRDEEEGNTVATVEDFYNDLDNFCDVCVKLGKKGLYVLDSLDSLSDEAEMDRKITEGTYAMNKAKKLSELFRKLRQKAKKSKVTVLLISQVRDNVGAGLFAKKWTVAGGKALGFYCSQRNLLAQMGKIKKTVSKIERSVGVKVKAENIKNKAGMPYRDCEFNIIFGYGIDDLPANIEWLDKSDFLREYLDEQDIEVPKGKEKSGFKSKLNKMEDDEFFDHEKKIRDFVIKKWKQVEDSFRPSRKKY